MPKDSSYALESLCAQTSFVSVGTNLFSVRSPASRPTHGDYPHQPSQQRKGAESRWHYSTSQSPRPNAVKDLSLIHICCNEFQNVLFAVDIGEGIIVHGLFEVDGVPDFQLLTVFQKCVPALDRDTTFGLATVYKGNIIINLIMDCQSYTKYKPLLTI